MFISDAYSGKCSDRYITQNSGFLDYLRAGDQVMGDRGFTIRDLLEEQRMNLIIPAFTCKGSQLTNEVTHTRRIAHACIHVEWAIRHLKVFKILSQTVPINLVPKIDKILKMKNENIFNIGIKDIPHTCIFHCFNIYSLTLVLMFDWRCTMMQKKNNLTVYLKCVNTKVTNLF